MDSWGRRSHCNARRALPADTYARGDCYGELAVIPQLKPSASNAHDRHFVDPCCTEANPPFKKPPCLWRLILRHALLLAHAYGQVVCGHVPS